MRSEWTSEKKMKNYTKEMCGNYKDSLDYAFDVYFQNNSGTTHMSIIYNIFIFYILFNQLNCRIIDDSLNIFKRIHKSIFFIIIIIVEVVLQIIIIFFGGISFQIVDKGLSPKQWGICLGFSAISFLVSIIGKFIFIDVLLDKFLSAEEEEPEFDPLAPEILECLNDKIKINDKETINEETLNDDEINMISEEINIKLGEYDYDFNKKDETINVKEIKEKNNLINNMKEITKDKDEKNNVKEEKIKENQKENSLEDNIENNIENVEVFNKKEETPSKKYKVSNLGRNLLNLPENYSTDDEEEFKLITLINESNDNYETVVDSKNIKVYAKIVSHYK